MARELVDDELWEIVKRVLPVRRRRAMYPHIKPVDDRRVLTGILFILQSGIAWGKLPREMGCGCGMTCWHRLRVWQYTGVWRRVHRVLLDNLRGADKLDFSRVVANRSSVRAVYGGKKLDRTQPIAVRRVASTVSSSMRKASRSMSC
jgi:transposase